MIKTGSIKNGDENGVVDPLQLSKISGVASAFACIRGEVKHNKRVDEKRQLAQLQKKYPSRATKGRKKSKSKRK